MCFVLLITGVGSLIHVYSVGYMEHDPDRRRFFGYLNLFVAAMLLLVLGRQLPAAVRRLGGRRPRVVPADRVLELQARRAATAAKKAFIVNRVGDVGLSIAIMIMFADVRHASASPASSARPTARASGALTAIGLLLLLGACGKSGAVPAAVLARATRWRARRRCRR